MDTVRRRRFIQRVKESGFSLKETQELSSLRLDDRACSCEVEVLDMMRPEVERRAKEAGARSVVAVAVNGALAG